MISGDTGAQVASYEYDKHDKLELGETLDLVAGLGNHEAKALLLLHLAAKPAPQTTTEMGRSFKAFIGQGSEWYVSPGLPFSYCRQSLEPLGQVVAGERETSSGYTKTFGITEKGRQVGVPMAGLLLQWSLDNPDLSLQSVFGSTISSGKVRAPQGRVELIAELLTSDKEDLSLSEVAGRDPETWRDPEYHNRLTNVDYAARALQSAGVVSLAHVNDSNNRGFIIKDPTYPTVGRPPDIYTRAVRKFVSERFEQGLVNFTFDECLDAVAKTLTATHPDMEAATIRRRISWVLGGTNKTGGVQKQRTLVGVEHVDTFNDGGHTRVQINAQHKEPLSDLLEILVGVNDEDQAIVEKGRAYADKIMIDGDLKQQVMAKAKKFSPHANKQSKEQTSVEILGILEAAGVELDTDSVLRKYQEKYARPLGRQSIQSLMRLLKTQNKIQVIVKPGNDSILKERNFYTTMDENS